MKFIVYDLDGSTFEVTADEVSHGMYYDADCRDLEHDECICGLPVEVQP